MEVSKMASTIQIRVDDDLKSKSDQLFKDLGTDTTSAIRMFLTQAVAYNGFPFEIKRTVHNPYTSMIEDEMLQRLEQSRESSKNGNVLDDFEDTVELLKHVAGSMKTCDNPRLQSLGYHRINFQKYRYFMLYRIEDDVVYVDDIFHELQDYENRMI